MSEAGKHPVLSARRADAGHHPVGSEPLATAREMTSGRTVQ
jgi:hypothetical protein